MVLWLVQQGFPEGPEWSLEHYTTPMMCRGSAY